MAVLRKIRKFFFMANKFYTDLKAPRNRYKIANDLHSQVLGEYYLLFDETRVKSGKDQKLIKRFDENGIPINKTYIDVTDKEYVYFPISIGQMGLSVFHTFLQTKSEVDKERFLKFAEWFYTNADLSTEFGARWLTDVALPQYHNPGPWASAFSQGRALNILLRAYQLAEDVKYADLAEKALIPFTKSAQNGGVTSYTQWGPFYEEYTAAVPTMVLNGKIFALWGLYDFKRVFPGNDLAAQLFDDGVNTLKNILSEYNLGFWSRYNHCETDWHPAIDPATIGYQRLHQVQMKLMYHLTGDLIFQEYAELFQKQDTFVNAVKMYFLKYKSLKKIGRL